MSYSTYWSYLYSVALLTLCLVRECALAPGRPDPLKGVYALGHKPATPLNYRKAVAVGGSGDLTSAFLSLSVASFMIFMNGGRRRERWVLL